MKQNIYQNTAEQLLMPEKYNTEEQCTQFQRHKILEQNNANLK